MNHFFRKLPLPAKLILIGLIPLIFLTWLSFRLYKEKSQKLGLLGSYIERMHQSADITKLIDNLQGERRYSFDYTLKKDSLPELLQQRPKTDSIIKRLSNYRASLSDFESYTFLKDLAAMRTAVDSGQTNITMVMDYYTNVLFRFNTLNDLPTASNIYLEPVYKDLVAQKLLSEMVTYLGIMSANVYTALHTRQYMLEILMGTRGVYQFYSSYEPEFLLKASAEAAQSYKKMKSASLLHQVTNYLDTVFQTFNYGNRYDAAEWRNSASAAVDELRNLQQTLLQNAEQRVNVLYENEQASKRNMLISLIVTLAFVISIIAYTIIVITKMLRELKQTAQKISKGETALPINIDSRDAIGSLANSISEIDKNNKSLAEAATAIGKGDFRASVEPRSPDDLLGNAIVQMKSNLQQLIGDLKNAQKEIDGLNKNLEQKVVERTAQLESVIKELESFSYSVSHDLRAPLRIINGYASILKEDHGQKMDAEAGRITDSIISNANKMGQLIDDLIALSRMGAKPVVKKMVDMETLAKSSVGELLRHEPADKYNIRIESLLVCNGDPNLLKQVWMNLIGNAIKYSSRTEHPCIEISSKEDAGSYIYLVKDNGVGFDMRYADKLFGVFQRLHTEEMFKGTGIGLALVKRIITRHNGEVVAESTPNKGATFYFTIPK